MNPRRTIRPLQLTLIMVLLVVGPVGFGLYLFSSTEKRGEPLLPAEVKIDTTWIGKDSDSERLVPCLKIRNMSSTGWKKLSAGLNEQFYSTGNMEVGPNQEIVLPLEGFIARNGSIRFPVGNRTITHVIVMAQISTGARGISEFLVEPASDSTPTDWIIPQERK
jgi:hypothetical protein